MPVTPNKGLLYPAPGAFVDAQDSYNLAIGADTLENNYITQLLAAAAPTAALARTTANGGTSSTTGLISPGASTAEYDPKAMVGSNLIISQPATEPLSYYLIGYDLLMVVTAGTPAAGNNMVGQMSVTTTDPLSGITTTTPYYKSSFESNNAGEQIQGMGIVKWFQGSVFFGVQFTNSGGTATYAIGPGSRSWALRLGSVPS